MKKRWHGRPALRPGRIVAAGVDWLTASAPADWPDARLLEEGDRLMALLECDGHQPEERSWHGYAIRRVGPVSCGLGEHGALVTVSGSFAAGNWARVARVAKRVSRLDLQVTVKPEPADPYLGHGHLLEVLEWQKERQRQLNVQWIGKGARWQTLNLGSRTSESWARIYDKGAESGEAEMVDTWRYEVQINKPLAERVARVLCAQLDPLPNIVSFVSEYFRRRGVEPRFDASGDVPRVASGRPRSSDARRLQWLVETVRPMMAGLVERGLGEEAWMNLGAPRRLARELDQLGPAGDAAEELEQAGDGA